MDDPKAVNIMFFLQVAVRDAGGLRATGYSGAAAYIHIVDMWVRGSAEVCDVAGGVGSGGRVRNLVCLSA